MAVWILEGRVNGEEAAVLIDGCSGLAFGPRFADFDEAQAFLEWRDSNTDPRKLDVRRLPPENLVALLNIYRRTIRFRAKMDAWELEDARQEAAELRAAGMPDDDIYNYLLHEKFDAAIADAALREW